MPFIFLFNPYLALFLSSIDRADLLQISKYVEIQIIIVQKLDLKICKQWKLFKNVRIILQIST